MNNLFESKQKLSNLPCKLLNYEYIWIPDAAYLVYVHSLGGFPIEIESQIHCAIHEVHFDL